MKTTHRLLAALALSGAMAGAAAAPFSSGSTGADGPLAPSANTTITLPASGVLHYTTINIPSGVTVRFVRGAGNPNMPAVLLATGDVVIAGTINVSGGDGLAVGNTLTGDRTIPGAGGPGGFDGGRGGVPGNRPGGAGQGPGAGTGGSPNPSNGVSLGGGGAGYGLAGTSIGPAPAGQPGAVYGSNLLIPLIGGSGGGGASGSSAGSGGGGGGGGGGALLNAYSV